MNDDRLTSAPREATACSNCGCPMFPPMCGSCGWVLPPEREPPCECYTWAVDENTWIGGHHPACPKGKVNELGGSD